jgi:chlorobactene glucosyltransferase
MTLLGVFHSFEILALSGVAIQTLLNRRAMARLDPTASPRGAPSVAVLIPARNEGSRIERCAAAWAAQRYRHREILVYDDDSSDDTAERAAIGGVGQVRVVRGGPLPDGWRGKPHACHELRRQVHAELLVFADADVIPGPRTLSSLTAAMEELEVTTLSALPVHVGRNLLLRAFASVQNWAALAFPPVWAARWRPRRAFASLNGQMIAIRAATYDAVGGFDTVRSSLAEDTALGRRLAERGFSVALLDGSRLLRCNPYDDFRQTWRANTRNLLPIFFGSAALLLLSMGMLSALYLFPPVLFLVGVASRAGALSVWFWLPLAETLLGLTGRRIADARFGYPVAVTLLHPVAVAALIAMSVGSLLGYRVRGEIDWRGRRYRLPRASL